MLLKTKKANVVKNEIDNGNKKRNKLEIEIKNRKNKINKLFYLYK